MIPTPHLLSLATAVPPYRLRQADVVAFARRLFAERPREDLERLLPVYANAGIETRYSCVPLEWYEQDHGWAEKNDLYVRHALDLSEQATRACLERAALGVEAIDAIVVASTSGIATPSLDARLAERLPLRRDVTRLPIFGLGCAGGVLGLARAAALAQAMPGAKVLFVVVELCGLTFRRRDQSKSNVIASALFGDGAAAALVSCAGEGPRLAAWGEHTWPASLDIMGWRVEDDGLGVLFSRDIPTLVRDGFRPALDGFLARHGLALADIDHFLCHPGGAKVIAALEEAVGVQQGGLALARAVLKDFGNMSAATVLFVLDQALANGAGRRGRSLLSAVGPGFSAGFMILEAA
ncbi:MAG: chalcone synthase [Rhodospirillales bacterium RIFCSPLOWO2_12_FULL_67_15]|nr:MAG: chalcone synthase [Rhodospirillales bacterium RIFCSPLOWO2_12_FULL_67_15]